VTKESGSSEFMAAWSPRIGPEAAATLWLSLRSRRFCVAWAGLFAGAEVLFQLLGNKAGITAAATLLIPSIWCGVVAVRRTTTAAQQAGEHLRLTPYEAKFVPLRIPSTFDMWISKRDHPKFPKVTRFS